MVGALLDDCPGVCFGGLGPALRPAYTTRWASRLFVRVLTRRARRPDTAEQMVLRRSTNPTQYLSDTDAAGRVKHHAITYRSAPSCLVEGAPPCILCLGRKHHAPLRN